MKGSDLYKMRNALLELSSVPNKNVAIMCAKNKSKVECMILDMERGMMVDENDPIAKYDEARLTICKEYAVKDEIGEPIIIKDGPLAGNYKIPDDKREEFETAILKLKTLYKDTLEARNARIAKYNEACNAEVDPDFIASLQTITLDELPDSLTGAQLEGLGPIVVEPPSNDGGLTIVR